MWICGCLRRGGRLINFSIGIENKTAHTTFDKWEQYNERKNGIYMGKMNEYEYENDISEVSNRFWVDLEGGARGSEQSRKPNTMSASE